MRPRRNRGRFRFPGLSVLVVSCYRPPTPFPGEIEMIIRLQTAAGRDIPNGQDTEISAYERNWSAVIPREHPDAWVSPRLSPTYNCHGLTFASRRTKVPPDAVVYILVDDRYVEVERRDARPGDVVIYYRDGEPSHSGIVIENAPDMFAPRVWSKWGSGPEVVHLYNDVHPVYGTDHRFLRCNL